MSKINKLQQNFNNIANAIREKEHSIDLINPLDFPSRIRALNCGNENIIIPPLDLSQFENKKLEDCSWIDIQRIAKAGYATKIFNIGDLSAPVQIKGNIAGTDFDILVRFRIIDFNHNSELEGNNTISFMLAVNTNNLEIALTDSKYASDYIAANTNALCMNRMGQIGLNVPDSTLDQNGKKCGPNKGGWEKSYGRIKVCDDFYNALPEDLRSVIMLSTIYSDNIGHGTGSIKSNITATSDKIYFLSEVELFGVTSCSNSFTSEFQTQMEWFKNENNRIAYESSIVNTCDWQGREPRCDDTRCFCVVISNGKGDYNVAARSYGIRPIFKI